MKKYWIFMSDLGKIKKLTKRVNYKLGSEFNF